MSPSFSPSQSHSHLFEIEESQDISESVFWTLLYTAERQSEHLLARAICSYVENLSKKPNSKISLDCQPDSFEATSGAGVMCKALGHSVCRKRSYISTNDDFVL